jgi:glutathione S-transferase
MEIGNQFCRLVREVFTELDLVYELKSAGKLSPRRNELADITGGSSQCPYLIDPNTGIKMAESKDIIQYLYKTYALFTPPDELLQSASRIMGFLAPLFKVLAPLQAGSYKDNKFEYESELSESKAAIHDEIASSQVVICEFALYIVTRYTPSSCAVYRLIATCMIDDLQTRMSFHHFVLRPWRY